MSCEAPKACPACDGKVVQVRGKLVCSKCGRVVMGCCE